MAGPQQIRWWRLLTRISSRSTYFYKKVFPALWLALLAFLVLIAVLGGWEIDLRFVSIVLATAVIGHLMAKTMVRNVADEVYDCGDFLLIRNKGAEERVPLSAIVDVAAYLSSLSLLTEVPYRVTIRFAGRAGAERKITFFPIRPNPSLLALNPFKGYRVVDDLRIRVKQARSSRNRRLKN